MEVLLTSHTNMKRVLGFSLYAVLFGLLGLTYKDVADMEGYVVPVLAITTIVAAVAEVKAPVFVDNYHEDW